jgi:hypothetical protein
MRRTRVKPTNPERKVKTRARAFGDKGSWIRARPCCVPGCRAAPRKVQAAHAIPQGMGSANGDLRHLVPLCATHHTEANEYRTTARADFELAHKLDRGQPGEGLVLLAAELHDAWEAGEDYGAPY